MLPPDEIDRLVAARQDARKRRDFAEGDRIRQQLLDAGIVLEDSASWYALEAEVARVVADGKVLGSKRCGSAGLQPCQDLRWRRALALPGNGIALVLAWIDGKLSASAAKILRVKSSKNAVTLSSTGGFGRVAVSSTSWRETPACSCLSRSGHGQVLILAHRSSRSLGRNGNVSAKWQRHTCF